MPTIQEIIKKIQDDIQSLNRRIASIGGAAGQANTASNIGAGGVGPYQQKIGVDLQFRNINAAAGGRITVALDAANNEIDLDVDPSNIDLDDLGDVNAGAPADGDVLTWDAGAGEWAPEAGGGGGAAVNPFAYRRTQQVYTTWPFYTATTQLINRDTLYAYPFIVPVSQSFDQMRIEVTTARTNGKARIGIYEDNGAVYPGDRVYGSPEIDCTANGIKSVAFTPSVLSPGLYWLVINHDGDANVGFRAMDYNQTTPIGYYAILGHLDNNFVTNPYIFWSVAQAYGALPDPFTGGGSMVNNANMVAIFMRVT